jgi:Domain of unknown function DUF29
MSDLYDRDFHAWANEQAALLRSGQLSAADIDHIAEEIESMGRSEKRELVSRMTVLLLHLLKWRFQPGLRGASWEASVRVQRIRLAEHLADNPSLRPGLAEAITSAYRVGRLEAAGETGLAAKAFPDLCPWSVAEIMDEEFWPS